MTLRGRLTLWYTAVLAVVLTLFGAAVYFILMFSMTRQVDATLDQTADDIRRAFQQDVRGITLPPLVLSLTSNVYVQVWDENGALAATNLAMMKQAFDPLNLGTESQVYSTVNVEGTALRVLTYPLVTSADNRLVGHLQLATSMETVTAAAQALLIVLVGGGLLAIAVAALVGYSTAWAALQPIDQVTETALQITRADDLSRRIPWSLPTSDEVGRLVTAINETLERLENLFEAQRRFMADVSHELRTPLTAIRGNVDLMVRSHEADPESLAAITSEVDRLTRMVQDLMVLSQAESGKLSLSMQEVELDTLLLEVFKQAKVLAQDRVEVRLGQEDQARVRGDRDRLKQVLLNLVGNALEHTPAGGDVTLGLACVGDMARVTVSDTGTGIPKEELPHIFERFYRVDRSRRRTAQGGAGLGLSIAYWITRNHGGQIEVASEEGKGSTFSVWLPLLRGSGGGAG
jgi:two-component system OmpR family sensor kinase